MNDDFEAILFDLDGTLVDTAPDMLSALFAMMNVEDKPALTYEIARASVSNGSLALVQLGFPDVGAQRHADLQQEFLTRYEKIVCRAPVSSVVFPGLSELIDTLDQGGRPWGIVTNKPHRMTTPLLKQLGLAERAACAISGDTLPERKPHPAPLLLGCEQMGVAPEKTIYVGDARRDIEAGRAAGLLTVAAAYGYIAADDNPDLWEADETVANTEELTKILLKAVNLAA